jgi:hypothetical protein
LKQEKQPLSVHLQYGLKPSTLPAYAKHLQSCAKCLIAQTTSCCPDDGVLLDTAKEEFQRDLGDSDQLYNFSPQRLLVVTWHNVTFNQYGNPSTPVSQHVQKLPGIEVVPEESYFDVITTKQLLLGTTIFISRLHDRLCLEMFGAAV